MTTSQLSPGTVVDGYTVGAAVRARVGATTYDATAPSGEAVQLTAYDAACFPSALVLERSLRELRQLQKVDVPEVIRVLGCGKLPGGGTYEVCVSVGEPSLAEHIGGGPMAPADAAGIMVQVGSALLAAQRVGVIHRNLGAAVVFPSPQGVRVGGFTVGEPQGGAAFGALDAMAPEQVEGKVVDQRTLIYNLAALMHALLAGGPLFAGDPASQLRQHASAEPGPDVHASLRRALGKDPRMRPMMLKQFIGELAAIGGIKAPDVVSTGAKPSTRGWTMFMEAQDDGPPTAQPTPAPAPSTPAPAPSAGAAPAPAPIAPGPPGSKPSTRGWTMFMKDGQPDPGAGAGPAEPDAPVSPSPPPAAAPASKPSTRGWTMFMKDGAEETPPTEGPASAPEPAPAAAEPAAPGAAAPGSKPSTRGWTMFMKAEGGEDEGADASQHPPASSAAPVPPPAGGSETPSTRGWTMFMKDGEGGGPEAPPATAPPDAGPPAAAPPDAGPPVAGPAPAEGDGAPTKRGWTMFMDQPAPTPGSAPPAQPQPAVAPEPAPDPGGAKRGWTLFMEGPLPQQQGEAPAEPPATDGASDNKGWTVFGAPSPMAKPTPADPEPRAPDAAAARAAAPTNPVPHVPAASVPDPVAPAPAAPVPPPGPYGQAPSPPSPGAPEAPRSKTMLGTALPPGGIQPPSSGVAPGMAPGMAPGVPAGAPGPGMPGVPTGPGVQAGSGPLAPPPDTMYFKQGETEPERPGVGRSPVDDVSVPVGGAALERSGPVGGMPMQAPPVAIDEPKKSGGPWIMVAVGGAIVVGVVVGVLWALT